MFSFIFFFVIYLVEQRKYVDVKFCFVEKIEKKESEIELKLAKFAKIYQK